MTHQATRRTVLLTAGAAGATALTAACGGGGAGGDTGSATDTGTSGPDADGGGRELLRTDDVPVGGGTVLGEEKIVVTQPSEGEFKAFSAICTHQNCLVSTVADGTIDCPCHGSRFRIADGSVERGPATRPLPEERITVDGNTIRTA
ncbi:Rieske (2Fe-2S) protein [Streptomyces sp. bgisy022]|uniref:Rieske (2Fe-2S) protein n=1 Tax=Streptomyces sp. bgisy022 TaxID=3413769 RepID=UPI003D732FD2